MRNHVCSTNLDSLIDFCAKVIKVCEAIRDGEYTRNACMKYGVDTYQFRRMIIKSFNNSCNNSEEKAYSIYNDTLKSKEEIFLSDLFNTLDWIYVVEDFYNAVDITFSDLEERESDILREFYFNGKTLEYIGNKYEISRQRTNQLRKRALNKLRHPDRIRYFKYGVATAKSMDKLKETNDRILREKKELLNKVESELKKRNALVTKVFYTYLTPEIRKKIREQGFSDEHDLALNFSKLDVSVFNESELIYVRKFIKSIELGYSDALDKIDVSTLDLSVRTKNCLEKYGVFNLKDFNKFEWSKFKSQKGVGVRVIDEVTELIDEYGLEVV